MKGPHQIWAYFRINRMITYISVFIRTRKYLDILMSRYTVFCIWIQFLLWKYLLKSYFVVITPKYDFLQVRQIRPKIIRRILKYEYDQPKHDSKKVKYAHILSTCIIEDTEAGATLPSFVFCCKSVILASFYFTRFIELRAEIHQASLLAEFFVGNFESKIKKVVLTLVFRLTTKGCCLLRTINDIISQSWPSEQLRQMIREVVL